MRTLKTRSALIALIVMGGWFCQPVAADNSEGIIEINSIAPGIPVEEYFADLSYGDDLSAKLSAPNSLLVNENGEYFGGDQTNDPVQLNRHGCPFSVTLFGQETELGVLDLFWIETNKGLWSISFEVDDYSLFVQSFLLPKVVCVSSHSMDKTSHMRYRLKHVLEARLLPAVDSLQLPDAITKFGQDRGLTVTFEFEPRVYRD